MLPNDSAHFHLKMHQWNKARLACEGDRGENDYFFKLYNHESNTAFPFLIWKVWVPDASIFNQIIGNLPQLGQYWWTHKSNFQVKVSKTPRKLKSHNNKDESVHKINLNLSTSDMRPTMIYSENMGIKPVISLFLTLSNHSCKIDMTLVTISCKIDKNLSPIVHHNSSNWSWKQETDYSF